MTEITETNTMAQILHYNKSRTREEMKTVNANKSARNQARVAEIAARKNEIQNAVDSISSCISFLESCYGDFQTMSQCQSAVALCQSLTVRKVQLLGSGW